MAGFCKTTGWQVDLLSRTYLLSAEAGMVGREKEAERARRMTKSDDENLVIPPKGHTLSLSHPLIILSSLLAWPSSYHSKRKPATGWLPRVSIRENGDRGVGCASICNQSGIRT